MVGLHADPADTSTLAVDVGVLQRVLVAVDATILTQGTRNFTTQHIDLLRYELKMFRVDAMLDSTEMVEHLESATRK